MNNTCKKCGCEDPIPSAPCPTSVGCPTPNKCKETFGTTCLTYTGDSIDCNNSPVIHKDTPINTVLTDIVNAICEIKGASIFDVTINNSESGLYAVVSTTSGPLTYKWSIEQGPFIGHTINGSNTLSNIQLDIIPDNGLRVGSLSGITKIVYVTHVRLEVKNGNGYTVTKFYTFANTLEP